MPIHGLLRIVAVGASALILSGAAFCKTSVSPCAASAQNIPQRSAHAKGAAEFIDTVGAMSERERDQAIRTELMAGNMPGFLRRAKPVSLDTHLANGEAIHLTLCVMADYLSVGTDDDFLLVPMELGSALTVADRFGFTLPTRRMVDLIYRQSTMHMTPQPLPAGNQMRSTAYYERHNALVMRQRAAAGATSNLLITGDKKDLVLSPRLWSQPGRVAIYGWQRANGAPIQPLSTVHGEHYADYSHGVRLVSKVVLVNGRPRSIFDLLADPLMAPLLSDEGTLPRPNELLAQTPTPTSGS
jgi:hypothetical protein